MLVGKLNIQKPCIFSANVTVMAGNVARNSGAMPRGALSTMGVFGVENMANAEKDAPLNLL